MTGERSVTRRQQTETAVAALGLPSAKDLALVREAIGAGERLSIDLLERAKMPTGGGQSWDVVNSDPVRALEGVLVLRHPVRVMWKARFADGGGGNPPDCFSMDNMLGTGDNGQPGTVHECATCPLAEWGTAVDERGEQARGKACRQVTRVFLLQPGDVLPMLIPLPPSSYREALTYVVQQAGKARPYYGVITRMTLKQDKSGGGITYSKANFEAVRVLTEEELATVQQYRDGILPYLNVLSVTDVESREAE